jgi:hypothetical protein
MDRQPATEECSTCTAWDPIEDNGTGYCKAHPPAVLFGANIAQPGSGVPQPTSQWPITREIDWCREYRAETPAP